MNRTILLAILAIFFSACAKTSDSTIIDDTNSSQTKQSYIQKLENENNISYEEIKNTYGGYVTSMCYTKTEDTTTNMVSNPCYSCHTKGKIPNYYNDTNLQQEYNFPPEIITNRFTNLFKDRSDTVSKISDEKILKYIRESNYFDNKGNIIVQAKLPKDWQGYRPDCYYHFDADGFDRKPNGEFTLWRAFRYYPFLGTFWPTNGSTDDVLIRLDEVFTKNKNGNFDKEVYELNLAIVESLIKQKDINLTETVDEEKYGVDLNQNETLDLSSQIVVSTYNKMSYIGKAKEALAQGKIHLALGLFPVNTEFLHSVRYVDWNENEGHIKMSKRLKELRYTKKYEWKTYSELNRIAQAELNEALANGNNQAVLSTFRGNYENGLKNEMGWIYQGFIEAKNGTLRPQTHEETIGCMGCHSHLGATTDSIFAFARKFEGLDENSSNFGWNHWTQKSLVGVKEPHANYQINDTIYNHVYEYSFYLKNNHSGNEFRNNDEVKNKFFTIDGAVKDDMLTALHNDITTLLFPSYERAMSLNKGYKAMVAEQSYIYGRDANIKSMKNIFKEINDGQTTNINSTIIQIQ